jgi:hypothetical protein
MGSEVVDDEQQGEDAGQFKGNGRDYEEYEEAGEGGVLIGAYQLFYEEA